VTCNPTDGQCECGTLWFDSRTGEKIGEEVACDEEQDVGEAMETAYSFFGIFVVIVLPFIFCTGGLAALAGVWRKDLGVTVYALREHTHEAVQTKSRKELSKAQREIEKRLHSAFISLDKDASGGIDEDELREILRLIDIPEEQAAGALAAVDKNDNGTVEVSSTTASDPIAALRFDCALLPSSWHRNTCCSVRTPT